MWLYAKPILDKIARVVFSERFWVAVTTLAVVWFGLPEAELTPYVDAIATLVMGIFLILGYSQKSAREVTTPTKVQRFLAYIEEKYGERP